MSPNRLSYNIPYLLPGHTPPIVKAAQSRNTIIAARRYAALGFSVLPLSGKRPALPGWRRYQDNPASLRTITAWGRAGLFGNVGIVCGEGSGGLVVLDLDGRSAYETFVEHFPEKAETFTVTTGSGIGRHVYLRVERVPDPARSLHTPLGNLELRSTGQQVAAPPSRHPVTGRSYTISCPFDLLRLVDIDDVRAWIVQLRRTPTPSSPPQHTMPPVTVDSGLIGAIADAFRSLGYRQNREWLNGPCVYPEHHAHRDRKPSFGFSTRTGYGYCWVCGSMLAKDIAATLGIKRA